MTRSRVEAHAIERGRQAISVVIVEDHAAVRGGLELLLRRDGHTVIGSAGDAATGERLVRDLRPDVAVVDLSLPDESGSDLIRRLAASDPELRFLVYTGLDDAVALADALDCGACGYALKAGPPEELKAAIETVARGGTYVDPRLEPLILARSTTERIGVLTAREREILDLLANGLTGEEAARRLFLSPETVRTHVRNAMEKLEAATRTHAVAIALRQGEIQL